MGKNSKIEWTHHTFNAWRGCEVVSPACDHCYAATQAKRNPAVLGRWGKHGSRVISEPKNWRAVGHWNDEAHLNSDEPTRVFINSMSDLFEQWQGVPRFFNGAWGEVAISGVGEGDDGKPTMPRRSTPRFGWESPIRKVEEGDGADAAKLDDLRNAVMWLTVHNSYLDFLFLTKRVEAMRDWMLAEYDCSHLLYENIWLGVTVEDRKHGLPRVEVLREIPAAVRWLSAEPLLEDLGDVDLTGIHWVVCGGESGHGARPMHAQWARRLRDQCKEQDVAFFFKQWGNALPSCQIESMTKDARRDIDGIEPQTCGPVASFDGARYWLFNDKHAAGRLLDEELHDAIPVRTTREIYADPINSLAAARLPKESGRSGGRRAGISGAENAPGKLVGRVKKPRG